MLQKGFFNLDNAAILRARRAHFYPLLARAFFFADFIIHDPGQEERHARTKKLAAP